MIKIYFHKCVVEWLIRYLPKMFERYFLDYTTAITNEMRRKNKYVQKKEKT